MKNLIKSIRILLALVFMFLVFPMPGHCEVDPVPVFCLAGWIPACSGYTWISDGNITYQLYGSFIDVGSDRYHIFGSFIDGGGNRYHIFGNFIDGGGNRYHIFGSFMDVGSTRYNFY